jgi:hypothetical protein
MNSTEAFVAEVASLGQAYIDTIAAMGEVDHGFDGGNADQLIHCGNR